MKDHQTNRLLFLSVIALMTNCWRLLFQIRHQIPSTAPQPTSSFIRCSVPQVWFNNDQELLSQHQNIFTDTIRNLDAYQVVLTLLPLCDNRVWKCYSWQWLLKNGDGFPFPPPFDIIAVAKMKREYRKDGILCGHLHQMFIFMFFMKTRFFFHSKEVTKFLQRLHKSTLEWVC